MMRIGEWRHAVWRGRRQARDRTSAQGCGVTGDTLTVRAVAVSDMAWESAERAVPCVGVDPQRRAGILA